MLITPDSAARKGRLSLSINQDILDRLEPYKQQINLSAQAEQLFAKMLEGLENRSWADRNAEALAEHGRNIAATGLAGEEFDRI
ncbi:MAG: type II toxin-antitoxin system CcdA family antitoxin [Candidatus Nitricoxidivorans perseverans]|uniref:Type II toxin-antitoxin system CcdA family antitoxin n=1 Tax=Candidatus Nitricoxidivorans perseverans TaxID=2975601 RepID=A0AA49FJQ0_9PROT|nr:MAG: type II toxin-antitoxin system CcdA family antitoxin [Candidatus Nitricoxidivorans perseverans]